VKLESAGANVNQIDPRPWIHLQGEFQR